MSEIHLEGTEELIRNLKRIDSSIRSQVAVQAVKEGAYQIFNRARINAPVLTSALRNSMKVDVQSVNGKAEAEISVNVVYARIQEFGGQTGRNHAAHINGKHYLGNAIESEKGAAVDAMGNTIKSYLGE